MCFRPNLNRYFNFFQALANSFEGNVASLDDVLLKGSKLRERCNSEGRITIDGKLKTVQRQWSDLSGKISDKRKQVSLDIGEWSRFSEELDSKITQLRNYDISLGTQITVTDVKALEKELEDVKVNIR